MVTSYAARRRSSAAASLPPVLLAEAQHQLQHARPAERITKRRAQRVPSPGRLRNAPRLLLSRELA
jgi:hypothetical protein